MAKNSSFMSDAVKLTASKIIANLLMMVSAMLLARVRTLEENGTYSQLMLIINLVASIFMLGLPNSINYFLAKAETKEDQNYFLSVYYTLSTLLSLVLGVTLVLLIPGWEAYFKNPGIGQYLFFLLLFPWARVVASSVENVLIILKKTTVLMVYRILNCVLLLGTILLIWLTGGSFKMYMILYTVVEGAFAVAVYVLAAHYTGRLRFCLDKQVIKALFVFSIPLGLSSIVGTLSIELDKLMIGRIMTTEELAIYTNASKELPVNLIATSITAVLMPQVVRLLQKEKREEAVALWRSATSISFAIISFIALACVAFAPEVITVLYSEKYLPGTGVFMVYSLVLLTRCTYWGMMLNATGNTKFIFYSSLGSLGLNVVLNFICFRLFGFVGPAIATFTSIVVIAIIQLVYTAKKVHIPVERLFPWKSCGCCLLLNGILGAVCYFVKELLANGLGVNAVLAAIIMGVVWFILYGGLTFKFIKRNWIFLNKAG